MHQSSFKLHVRMITEHNTLVDVKLETNARLQYHLGMFSGH